MRRQGYTLLIIGTAWDYPETLAAAPGRVLEGNMTGYNRAILEVLSGRKDHKISRLAQYGSTIILSGEGLA